MKYETKKIVCELLLQELTEEDRREVINRSCERLKKLEKDNDNKIDSR